MLAQFTTSEKCKLACALILGLALGFTANYNSKLLIKEDAPALDALKNKIVYATIQENVKRCTITATKVNLLSEPSALNGKILQSLQKGLQVDFLETVPSLDKDAKQAKAAYDLQFKELFFFNVEIPKETPFTIKSETKDQYYCSFNLKNKKYTKHFDKELVTRAYTGNWNKVQINDTVGYIQVNQASAPKYQ